VASPHDIYSRPATLFVGSFVGSMNVFERLPVAADGAISIGAARCKLPALAGLPEATLGVRPEDIAPVGQAPLSSATIALDGTVEKVTYAGREAFYRWADGGGIRLLVHVFRPDTGRLATTGDRLRIQIPLTRLHAFEPAGGRRIELAGTSEAARSIG
jgi:ABC-type Fe3+/spermidine/putrescine transport system ATPase subunit